MNNKNIFSINLKRYMQENDKTRKEVSEALGVSYYTFSDWVNRAISSSNCSGVSFSMRSISSWVLFMLYIPFYKNICSIVL